MSWWPRALAWVWCCGVSALSLTSCVVPLDCVEAARAEYGWQALVWPAFGPEQSPDKRGRLRFRQGPLYERFMSLEPGAQAQAARLGALGLELEVLARGAQPAVVQRYLFSFERDEQGQWWGYLAPAYPQEVMELWLGRGTIRVQAVSAEPALWGEVLGVMAFEVDYHYQVWSNSTEYTFTLEDQLGRLARHSKGISKQGAVQRVHLGEDGRLGLSGSLLMESRVYPVMRCQ